MLHLKNTWKSKICLPILLYGINYVLGDFNEIEDISQSHNTALKMEAAMADLAIYTVFTAPVTWDALIFQTYVQKRKVNEALELSKLAIGENISALTNILKNSNSFIRDLKRLLKKYERAHLESYPYRNRLFKGTLETYQTEQMQEKSIEKPILSLATLTNVQETFLKEKIEKLIKIITNNKNTNIWPTYKTVIEKAIKAAHENMPVSTSIKIAVKEFKTICSHILLNKLVNEYEFKVEKAKFNLGGGVYSPGLLLEIAAKLKDADKDRFIQNLISSLIEPLLQIKNKVSAYKPADIKEEVIKYVNALTDSTQVYDLRKEISESQVLRSESICRRIDKLPTKEKLSERIDEVQIHNTNKMLKILQETSPESFKNFLVVDRQLMQKYIEYVKTGGGDEKLKSEIEAFFGLF